MSRYLVKYPGGQTLRLRGELNLTVIGDAGLCPVIHDGDRAVVLDPRAIIQEQPGGRIVYRPSAAMSELAPWVRAWMSDHLAWEAAW